MFAEFDFTDAVRQRFQIRQGKIDIDWRYGGGILLQDGGRQQVSHGRRDLSGDFLGQFSQTGDDFLANDKLGNALEQAAPLYDVQIIKGTFKGWFGGFVGQQIIQGVNLFGRCGGHEQL